MESTDDNTYTITGGPLKPHEYIVIRAEMTAADEAWIQNHSASIGGTKKKPEMMLTIGDIKLAALKRLILRWRLSRTVKSPIDGSETQVEIPLSHAAIENLPRKIAAYINRKIDDLNPEDDEDDEDFTPAANGPAGGSSQTMKMLSSKD
ncbi:MAG: hypothetical protein H0W02_10175 [Ktedonobacteraceae bacterium]|nr:hypothetical protein [Ktedonobacteraceae bacterium]